MDECVVIERYYETTENGVSFVVRYVGKDVLRKPIFKISAQSKTLGDVTLGFSESVQEAISDCIDLVKDKPHDWFIKTYALGTY